MNFSTFALAIAAALATTTAVVANPVPCVDCDPYCNPKTGVCIA